MAAGDIDPERAVCLSDDPLDLDCARGLGIRPLFAAYGRVQWCTCFGGVTGVALSPAQVPRLLGVRASPSWSQMH